MKWEIDSGPRNGKVNKTTALVTFRPFRVSYLQPDNKK